MHPKTEGLSYVAYLGLVPLLCLGANHLILGPIFLRHLTLMPECLDALLMAPARLSHRRSFNLPGLIFLCVHYAIIFLIYIFLIVYRPLYQPPRSSAGKNCDASAACWANWVLASSPNSSAVPMDIPTSRWNQALKSTVIRKSTP